MRKVKLSDVCDISSGGTPSRSNPEYFKGDIPWAKISDIENADNGVVHNTEEYISIDGLKNIRGKLFPKGTLLFAMYGSIGKVGICGRELSTNQAILGIRPRRDDEIDLNYLKTWFSSNKQRLVNQGRGVALKNLSATIVRDLEIDLPDLDDQIRIAHLLGKVEGLIAQRKQHLRQLDDLLKSAFLEMFGDPMSNPKKWPDSGLGDALTFLQYGPRFYNEPYSADGIRIVRITDLSESGDLDFSEMPRLDVTSEEKEKFLLKPGDLIFARTGATVGKVALIRPNDPPAIAGAYFIVMRFQPTLLPLYVRFVLTSSSVRTAIVDRSRQAAQPNFSGPGLRKLPMPRPPIELQRDFAEVFEKVADLKVHYQHSLAGLQDLYGALSQQAFKGELDLSRVALPAAAIEGASPDAAAMPAHITTPVIHLPETDLLLPALQERTQLEPLLRFWLEAYRTQLGRAAFSLERFIAAAQTRLGELHPDNDFELGATDYEQIKTWVFEALSSGRLVQAMNVSHYDDVKGEAVSGNIIELKANQP